MGAHGFINGVLTGVKSWPALAAGGGHWALFATLNQFGM